MNSVIIGWGFKFMALLNGWYEHSGTYGVIQWLHRAMKQSFFIGPVYQSFTVDRHRDYTQGSLLLGLPLKGLGLVFQGMKGGFLRVPKGLFETSFAIRTLNSSVVTQLVLNLPISFSLFVMGMLVIPSHLWSNLFILLAAVVFWGIYGLGYLQGKYQGLKLRYVTTSLLIYVFFAFLSFLTGFGGMDSIRVFSIMGGSIALGLLAIHIIDSEKKLHWLMGAMFTGLLLSSLFGLLQYFVLGIAVRTDFIDLNANFGIAGRLYATMGNPNNFAKVLTMFIPLCVAMVFAIKNPWVKLILTGLLLPMVLALVLTYSRASYLAVAGSTFVFVLMKWPRLVPLGILLGLLAIPFIPEVILMRLGTIGTDTSSLYRIQIWEGSWRTVQNYWSSGIGIGPSAFQLIYRAHAHNMAGNAMHAHNVFLNVWVEVGIGGAIAMVIYNFNTVRGGIVAFLNTKNIAIQYYLAGGVASLVGFLMFSMVEHVWFYPRAMLAYFIVMGVIWAAIRLHEKEKRG